MLRHVVMLKPLVWMSDPVGDRESERSEWLR